MCLQENPVPLISLVLSLEGILNNGSPEHNTMALLMSHVTCLSPTCSIQLFPGCILLNLGLTVGSFFTFFTQLHVGEDRVRTSRSQRPDPNPPEKPTHSSGHFSPHDTITS